MRNQLHSNHKQREDLHRLFEQHKKLFGGKLRVYPHKKCYIGVEKGSKPKHVRPYTGPHSHMDTFKKELQYLVELGVLEPQGTSERALPTFIIPKKDS